MQRQKVDRSGQDRPSQIGDCQPLPEPAWVIFIGLGGEGRPINPFHALQDEAQHDIPKPRQGFAIFHQIAEDLTHGGRAPD